MTDFYFNDNEIGVFDSNNLPIRKGQYSYEAYRSLSHLIMIQQIEKGKKAESYYYKDNVKVTFSIVSCPNYGVLELDNFEIVNRNKV